VAYFMNRHDAPMSLEAAVRKLHTAEAGVPRAQERAAQIVREAREKVTQARADLAEEIRAADRAGMRQVDIVAATGYSRERVRQILLDA
jgi:ribosome-binding protein aMBF1 (putative translation factor)